MIKAVIYSRVSSEGNRQDTERQTNELIEYANKMGYKLVEVYEEKVSGYKKNEDRPIFSKMLEEIEKGAIDKVLVWELSRIGRSVIQSLQNIQLLTDKKVSIYIKNFNLETLNDDKTPNSLSMFMVQILFSVANMEAQLTKSRMVSGYRNHINNGGKVGRKSGSIETEEETIQKHSDVLKLLKKKLSIRQISGLTNKSTNTVLKVKSTAHKLQMI
ncbi:recombinase family protein [Flavobacterium sp.]|jgi:DNA invertase Pin-like site-specific DNA recombinase|uniref:recombinase family protein n=1 Tax=Flavobacterium sp. TaxID=239 RepID=UPI002631D84F|nr:recombinase family protein [Flavobacterium sp.]